ncbi:hypothetical protein, partial [Phaeodactylibacter sp.]|uniref:hypothetical protein n=1 Tax=Phaeodactylibacter sp. TaxID=1940289 RepID=UPI0025FC40D1
CKKETHQPTVSPSPPPPPAEKHPAQKALYDQDQFVWGRACVPEMSHLACALSAPVKSKMLPITSSSFQSLIIAWFLGK